MSSAETETANASTAVSDHGPGIDEVLAMKVEVAELREWLTNLRHEYVLAGASVRDGADADVELIRQLRQEAESLVKLVRSATLFGRYADDADHHRRQANRWRRFAVAILVMAVGLAVYFVVALPDLAWYQVAVPMLPLALLFTYASIESHNHRRAELDRKRIYLRMAAIESYTTTDISDQARDDLGGLLYKFIEKHFIEPQLDPNELSSVSAGWPTWRARVERRGGGRQSQ
ncbi:hypothetical protein [Plantactinospora sp. KLBMP9567]|uniref:hypothetical protein n=1 Tax=Plantactinospora sp. KLBMP9567 TaxID=3085900 RepID=UPI002980BA5A|nr:hypothetical protein [Plantactinospora sp. KLBMP9567]MDW5323188.1 hypothetical protein [Plantactinospora sp. KLBMP9567]